jgi:hypothetical protein
VFESQVGPIFLPFCAFWHDDLQPCHLHATRSTSGPLLANADKAASDRQLHRSALVRSRVTVRHSSLVRCDANGRRFTCSLVPLN